MYPILNPIFTSLTTDRILICVNDKYYRYYPDERRIYQVNPFTDKANTYIRVRSIGFIEFNHKGLAIYAGTESNNLLNFLNAHDVLVWCTKQLLKQAS